MAFGPFMFFVETGSANYLFGGSPE